MAVAGSPMSGSPLATGIRKSYNPGYMGPQPGPPPPHVLSQGPGPGYPEAGPHNNLPQHLAGWQQPPGGGPPPPPHPYYRGVAALGIRGESMAHAQMPLMPGPDGGASGGLYYGPSPPAGARLARHAGGPMAAGRAMYLSRQHAPFMDPLQGGPPGSPGLQHMMEGRGGPPGYHATG